MKQEEDKFTGLPENAFRELKAGEVYNPLMSPSKNYPEVNFWSVTWGIAMAILFSAGAESGTSIRSRYSDSHHCRRSLRCSQKKKCVRRKCNYPVYRSVFRCNRCRSHLYPPRPLYPSSQIS